MKPSLWLTRLFVIGGLALSWALFAPEASLQRAGNELLGLARALSPAPGRRELDMLLSVGERISMALLSMAINDLGAPAVSLTGSQSGIITDTSHSAARAR